MNKKKYIIVFLMFSLFYNISCCSADEYTDWKNSILNSYGDQIEFEEDENWKYYCDYEVTTYTSPNTIAFPLRVYIYDDHASFSSSGNFWPQYSDSVTNIWGQPTSNTANTWPFNNLVGTEKQDYGLLELTYAPKKFYSTFINNSNSCPKGNLYHYDTDYQLIFDEEEFENDEYNNPMLSKNDKPVYNENYSNRRGDSFGDGTGGFGGSSSSSGTSTSGSSSSNWCTELMSVWSLIGHLIQILYVATPLILIISGSITLIKAMMQREESAIKKAQNVLIKKIIAAVLVFLVITITKVVVGFFGDDAWQQCAKCVLNPRESNCKLNISSS